MSDINTDLHLAYLENQNAIVQRDAWEQVYTDLPWRSMVPVVSAEGSEYAREILHYTMDGGGEAQWASNVNTNFPTVHIQTAQHSVVVNARAIGYDYDVYEVEHAMQVGQNLSSMKARMSRRIHEEDLQQMCWFGISEFDWDGLFNGTQGANAEDPDPSVAGNPREIPRTQFGTSDTDSFQRDSTSWQEIVKSVQDAISGVWVDSKGVLMADTVLMPLSQWSILTDTVIPDMHNRSIYEHIRQFNAYTARTGRPLMILALNELETAGRNRAGAATSRMIAYKRDPDVLRWHEVMPLRYLEAQRHFLKYVIPGMYRVGGLEIRQPQGIRYVDGI